MRSSAGRFLPPSVRSWLKGLRTTYVRTAHAFGPEDLKAGLERVGVVRGDVVMIHSAFDSFKGFRGTPSAIIRSLQEVVGPEGTLLMPTLPFTGSMVEYAATAPVFDPRRTISKTGLIAEIFRRSPQVLRSLHPTHSVAAWGARAQELIAGHELAGTPCGRATPYGRLLELGGKILFLGVPGVPAGAMTFFHAIEELLVEDLPVPLFEPGECALQYLDELGAPRVAKTRLFSLQLAGHRDVAPLVAELKRRGAWCEARVAGLGLILLRARDALDATTALAGKGVFCYKL